MIMTIMDEMLREERRQVQEIGKRRDKKSQQEAGEEVQADHHHHRVLHRQKKSLGRCYQNDQQLNRLKAKLLAHIHLHAIYTHSKSENRSDTMLIFRGNKLFTPVANLIKQSQFRSAHKLAESLESEKQELFLDKENCILVDENDKNVGFASKRDCHKVHGNDIKLHRAFSVFLFNKQGDMLLQKRSNHKVKIPQFIGLVFDRDTKVIVVKSISIKFA
jgi:isopentenyldiphosphate isomerase